MGSPKGTEVAVMVVMISQTTYSRHLFEQGQECTNFKIVSIKRLIHIFICMVRSIDYLKTIT